MLVRDFNSSQVANSDVHVVTPQVSDDFESFASLSHLTVLGMSTQSLVPLVPQALVRILWVVVRCTSHTENDMKGGCHSTLCM